MEDPANPPAPPADPAVTPPAAPAAPPAAAPAAPPASDAAPDPLAAAMERIAKLETDNRVNLRARILAETGVDAKAAEFITATDEAGMKAQAEKLKGFAPAATSGDAPPPAPAGTQTAPAGTKPPTLDEQIATAEAGSDIYGSIRLKLQKLGA